MRAFLALETGWTLEYIDSLSVQDFYDVVGFILAKREYHNYETDLARQRAKGKKR